ncbi:MAG: TetR/AcrR family transcriptional regulator [Ilumatobacteraceae bacterium]|nr:TetR/AcrR family transcriptional regulator [Ilumatobacteraceae bacterium]
MLDLPKRDRRAERREATIAEILDAAWELVREEGLAGLSMRDLAGRVGMQAPSLYSYFESKHAIYDAMFAQGARAYLEQEALVASTGDPLADLQAGCRFFVVFCTENPVRYQLMFQRTIPGFEPSSATFALSIEGLERLKARLAGVGITDQRSLDLLTALGTGITDQQISNDPGGDRWTSLVDEAIEMYFNHATTKTTHPRRTRK